jgi:orotate phosphoribosyltransferase
MLSQTPGVVASGHFVLRSGRHADSFVRSYMIMPDNKVRQALCLEMAHSFVGQGIGAVLAPAIGGVPLSVDVARCLQEIEGRDVAALWAERDKKTDPFYLRSGFELLVRGRKILCLEDVTTTGGSVMGVIDCARREGGTVAGVSSILNRSPGIVTANSLGVSTYHPLIEKDFPSWPADECPLCAQGVPLDDPKKVKL